MVIHQREAIIIITCMNTIIQEASSLLEPNQPSHGSTNPRLSSFFYQSRSGFERNGTLVLPSIASKSISNPLRKSSNTSVSTSSEGSPPITEPHFVPLIQENPKEEEEDDDTVFSREALSFLNGLDFGDEESSKKQNQEPNDSTTIKKKQSAHKHGEQPDLQCLTTQNGFPLTISSNLFPGRKYQKKSVEKNGPHQGVQLSLKGHHYSKQLQAKERYDYEPLYLETSKMGLGKFKTVISLDGYRLSFMPFVPASRLKEELNDEQRKKYPWID